MVLLAKVRLQEGIGREVEPEEAYGVGDAEAAATRAASRSSSRAHWRRLCRVLRVEGENVGVANAG